MKPTTSKQRQHRLLSWIRLARLGSRLPLSRTWELYSIAQKGLPGHKGTGIQGRPDNIHKKHYAYRLQLRSIRHLPVLM